MRSGLCVLLLILVIASGVTVVAQDKKYEGVDKCNMCHSDVVKDWSKTAHSKSFDLLVNTGQEKNAECLPCHSTGYGKGGFVDEATTPKLEGTVCEGCHGPGSEHAATMDTTKIQRVPPATVCGGCHQKTNIHSIAAK